MKLWTFGSFEIAIDPSQWMLGFNFWRFHAIGKRITGWNVFVGPVRLGRFNV